MGKICAYCYTYNTMLSISMLELLLFDVSKNTTRIIMCKIACDWMHLNEYVLWIQWIYRICICLWTRFTIVYVCDAFLFSFVHLFVSLFPFCLIFQHVRCCDLNRSFCTAAECYLCTNYFCCWWCVERQCVPIMIHAIVLDQIA